MIAIFRQPFRRLRKEIGKRRLSRACRASRGPLFRAVQRTTAHRPGTIPVCIVCYNNGIYVDHMIGQLAGYGIRPIVIDNASTEIDTQKMLDRIGAAGAAEIVHCSQNFGHMVGFIQPHYEALPDVFAYTDPDLQFSDEMPVDFLSILACIAQQCGVYKAGMALHIDKTLTHSHLRKRRTLTTPFIYNEDLSLSEWEQQHWRFQLRDEDWPIYAAPVDTTFAVYRKANYRGNFYDAVRVSGNLEAIHLPWYPALDIMTPSQKAAYLSRNASTNWVGEECDPKSLPLTNPAHAGLSAR